MFKGKTAASYFENLFTLHHLWVMIKWKPFMNNTFSHPQSEYWQYYSTFYHKEYIITFREQFSNICITIEIIHTSSIFDSNKKQIVKGTVERKYFHPTNI